MFLELAIGDAYGAAFEFRPQELIAQCNSGEDYLHGGTYTDDTQMSIAVARALEGLDPTKPDDHYTLRFANFFVDQYKQDRRSGYAQGFQSVLDRVDDGEGLLRIIWPNSVRNGAAMRSCPLGLVPGDIEYIIYLAEVQAAVTHGTFQGITSSQVVAMYVHYLRRGKLALEKIPAAIESRLDITLSSTWIESVPCDAMSTVHAVNTALQRNRSLKALLIDCVNFGGDTDSVASIALGIASVSNEYTNDLPKALYDNLERGPFGFEYLKSLDVKAGTYHEI